MENLEIFNRDCLEKNELIKTGSVDLGIFDPPFGLGESSFDKHYKRNSKNVISGYEEAPDDYEEWTYLWLCEARRILKENGSMYVFMGHTNLRCLLNAAYKLGLYEINHLVWKYNFGVYTKKKYVTSHYHLLYYSKLKNSPVVFNTNCRFSSQEKNEKGGSLLYQDLEDVFIINKEYFTGKEKNQNKLPEEIIKKIILYSSNKNDLVCDFFMGNFTTAYVALKYGRRVCGYEKNTNIFNHHKEKLQQVDFGCELKNLKKVVNIPPPNTGKKITENEKNNIGKDYNEFKKRGETIKDITLMLQKKYGRGKFSIKNILDSVNKNEK